jgi:hypothetical protein
MIFDAEGLASLDEAAREQVEFTLGEILGVATDSLTSQIAIKADSVDEHTVTVDIKLFGHQCTASIDLQPDVPPDVVMHDWEPIEEKRILTLN